MRYLLGALVLVLLIAAPAHGATDYPCADNETNCDPYAGDEPDTMGSKTGGGWVGGDYIQCTARGKMGQRCWEKVDTPDGGFVCGGVMHNAACACNTKTGEVKGLCVYYQ